MKILIGSLILWLAVVLTLPLTASAAPKSYQEIDAEGVRGLMLTDNPLLVFPLSPIEYEDLHIAGSVNIPLDRLAEQLPTDKERKLIFYCLGVKCVASWRAAEMAGELGYRSVYAFREGLPAWVAAGYPTTTIDKLPDVEIDKISTEELSQSLALEDMVLLDINLPEDAQKFYIEHEKRVHIPLDNLKSEVSTLPKNKRIAVICLKGQRSETAGRYLKGQGFDDVVIVEGGIQSWIMDGRQVKQVE